MFLEISDLLTPEEAARLRSIAAATPFVDGRISNPHNQAKNNLQADQSHAGYKESSKLLAQALWRSEPFRNFAFPKRFAAPMLCRYEPGMNYGRHADAAFIPLAPEPLRTDVSATIYLSDPATYDGGELVIYAGDAPMGIKGHAGSAVVYASTFLHEVRPVTKGERLVAITFVQSQIRDERRRQLLHDLNEVAALEGLKMAWENRTRLEHVRYNLQRMWSD